MERFVDGELERALVIRVEEHLERCHPCGDRAEFRRHLKLIISEKCSQHSVPASLQEKISVLIRHLDETPSA
jgi:mycothiol system anti-sigma-R factor